MMTAFKGFILPHCIQNSPKYAYTVNISDSNSLIVLKHAISKQH